MGCSRSRYYISCMSFSACWGKYKITVVYNLHVLLRKAFTYLTYKLIIQRRLYWRLGDSMKLAAGLLSFKSGELYGVACAGILQYTFSL